MSHTTTQLSHRLEPFYSAIGARLEAIGKTDDDFELDLETGDTRFVARLCRDLLDKIGRSDLSIQDVLSAEHNASGHADYQRRLAWACAELAAQREAEK